MLCQFSVKNFKSIRDEIIFDMQAAAISEHTDRVIKDVDNHGAGQSAQVWQIVRSVQEFLHARVLESDGVQHSAVDFADARHGIAVRGQRGNPLDRDGSQLVKGN